MRRHLLVHFLQVFLQFGNFLLDNPPVHLDLGLSHTAAGAHAAPLPLQVGPHTGEARKHVLIMSQFHLHLGVGCLGPLGKDFQDEAGPVDDIAALDGLFDVSLLHPGEFIVEDDVFDLVLAAVLLDFLQFPRADIRRLVRAVQALGEEFIALCAGGFRQELQLFQILLHFALATFFQDDAHKHGFISLEFAHRLQRYEK